ncbi:MAG: sodium:solute symporter family protein [Planctomycetes bacterium]|nr:sodium:solute symporter family protein [Planctomycetota bacterium]
MMPLLAVADRTPLIVILVYLVLLLGLGYVSTRWFRGTSSDYFVATRSIGPFLLLMSIFGTTMTAFALVGSTAKAYDVGIGVYGLMASSSGLVHSLVFYLVGVRLWAIGKRHDYVTQIQFFRDRFDSNALGYLLFPILVGLVVPYLLIGVVGAGIVVRGVTRGMFPDVFPGVANAAGEMLFVGAVPPWLTGLVICGVVLFYVSGSGLRGAAWANTMQTLVFMLTGLLAFVLIAHRLGGFTAASEATLRNAPELMSREGMVTHAQFLSYLLVPVSVGMFPHVFQHWLTARSAKTFRLSLVAHPLCILLVWVPCILIGVWVKGHDAGLPIGDPGRIVPPGVPSNGVLAVAVDVLIQDPFVTGLLAAGILAAIMSSLDSQFVCLGTMFTHDVVLHALGRERFSDRQTMWLGRSFVVGVVGVVYLLSLLPQPHVFDLAVWCFSGFTGLFPLVFAALHWRRVTKTGAIASVVVTAASWIYLFREGMLVPLMRGEKVSQDVLVLGVMPVVLIFALSTVTLVLVSLVTRPFDDEHVDRFLIRKRIP